MSERCTVDSHLMSLSSDQTGSCSGWAGITTASPIEHLQHRETFCTTAHQVLRALTGTTGVAQMTQDLGCLALNHFRVQILDIWTVFVVR